jgi:hypothetical protein
MNTEKKSLVEEALLQMKNLENVVTENAKGILASTMKEEIEELVKESLEGTEEKMSDESYEMEEGTHMSMYEDEDEDSTTIDITATDDDTMMMGDDFGAETDDDDEIAPLDLTQGVSDEELMKIVMGMGEDDRLMIAKSGDDVDVDMMKQTDSMSFPMGGEELSDEDEMNFSEPALGNEVEEEIVYEIEMSEDYDENDENAEGVMESKNKTYVGMGMGKPKFSYEKSKGGFKDDKKVAPEAKKFTKGEFKESAEVEEMDGDDLISAPETSEASRTYGNGKRNYPKRHGLPKMKVEPNKALEEEVRVLRLKNEEYRKALNIFREKLNEVAVFNSNLAYATRLFTEHTTTKQEKINIMRRFDNVETIKESKNLYSQIKNELGTKDTTVVKESIVENIDRTPTKGSTNLVENKTYENPQFLRMKDLMSKLTK